MKIEIKCRFTGRVLFEHDCENNTIKTTVEKAVELKADLSSADLSYANLRSADLSSADLSYANLHSADLRSADLSYANLRSANLDDGSKIVGERSIIQIGPIGSEQRTLIAFRTDSGIKLMTGCFFGSVHKFKAQLTKKHAGNNHEKEYLAALQMIETRFELWK